VERINSQVAKTQNEDENEAGGQVILRGKKIGYAAIRGRLGGNTRQGNGPSSAYCRVLPDIAA
jgi:hypothetical protein